MTPSTVKLPLHFEPQRLKSDLQYILSSDFVAHFNTHYYQGDWSVAPLRSIGGRMDQIYPDPTATNWQDTPLMERCPNLREVVTSFQCEKLAVRLLRLRSGSVIKEHRDFSLSFEDGEARLHIPVTTNSEVEFVLDGKRIVMSEGECWYHNFNLPHRVSNLGQSDRIHLVLDLVVNDWLKGLIATPPGPQQQAMTPRPNLI
jgi:hypothetical protein